MPCTEANCNHPDALLPYNEHHLYDELDRDGPAKVSFATLAHILGIEQDDDIDDLPKEAAQVLRNQGLNTTTDLTPDETVQLVLNAVREMFLRGDDLDMFIDHENYYMQPAMIAVVIKQLLIELEKNRTKKSTVRRQLLSYKILLGLQPELQSENVHFTDNNTMETIPESHTIAADLSLKEPTQETHAQRLTPTLTEESKRFQQLVDNRKPHSGAADSMIEDVHNNDRPSKEQHKDQQKQVQALKREVAELETAIAESSAQNKLTEGDNHHLRRAITELSNLRSDYFTNEQKELMQSGMSGFMICRIIESAKFNSASTASKKRRRSNEEDTAVESEDEV